MRRIGCRTKAGVSRVLGPTNGGAVAAGYSRVRYAPPAIAEFPRSLLYQSPAGLQVRLNGRGQDAVAGHEAYERAGVYARLAQPTGQVCGSVGRAVLLEDALPCIDPAAFNVGVKFKFQCARREDQCGGHWISKGPLCSSPLNTSIIAAAFPGRVKLLRRGLLRKLTTPRQDMRSSLPTTLAFSPLSMGRST